MKDLRLSRRNFLSLASAGLAGAYVNLNADPALARMCGMMRGTGAAIVDPPPGAGLKDPVEAPNFSSVPGVVEVSLEAKQASVNINGTMTNLLTYNGYFNGPTIRVRRGDTLRVRFKNSLPATGARNALGHEKDPTNLHTHGLHVSPSGNSDNVHLHFNPGEEFLYEYDLSKQEDGALGLYHPHVHGSVADQFWAGLVGTILVEDDGNALAGYETHILVLKDICLSGNRPEPHNSMDFVHGKEGPVVMVNGQVNPVLSMRPGEVQRWRILNASNARYYRLNFQGHTMHVIGTDGGLADKPYPLTECVMAPSERLDILVKASAEPGTYKLLSLPYNRGCGGSSMQTVTLMTVQCEGNLVRQDIPPVIDPDAAHPQVDIDTLPRRKMVLGMRMGQGFINGRTFGPDAFELYSQVGTYEVWEVYNASCMDHPFHQHVNHAHVLRMNGGHPGYARLMTTGPFLNDTVNIPKMGSALLLVSVQDYTGSAMMHCHIIEHEDIGMMGWWHIS